jgi:hypothetical protein|tara:strand:+ start:62 stop:553 length:492 start_codon:yes stop_codon:yes gene_type:complete
MASTLKVNTIQTAAGGVGFITDLGMKAKYFAVTVGDTTCSAGSATTYDLSSLIGTGATLDTSNDTLTVTEAGDYLLCATLGCSYTSNSNSRYQENYVFVNSTKIMDLRDNITNIDSNYEYYTVVGSRIYTLAANDVLKLQGNGQGNWQVRAAYGSNFFGIRLG